MKMKALLSILLLVSFYGTANAVLISTDYASSGDNLITQDTNSNLDWLDLSATQGLSATDILNGAGGWIREFRYATHDEFTALLSEFGLYHEFTARAEKYDDAYLFNEFLNTEHTACGPTVSCGLFISDLGNTVDVVNVSTGNLLGFSAVWDNYASLDWSNYGYGSFLVRESLNVPEPSSLLLLGSTLFFIGFMRKRKTV